MTANDTPNIESDDTLSSESEANLTPPSPTFALSDEVGVDADRIGGAMLVIEALLNIGLTLSRFSAVQSGSAVTSTTASWFAVFNLLLGFGLLFAPRHRALARRVAQFRVAFVALATLFVSFAVGNIIEAGIAWLCVGSFVLVFFGQPGRWKVFVALAMFSFYVAVALLVGFAASFG